MILIPDSSLSATNASDGRDRPTRFAARNKTSLSNSLPSIRLSDCSRLHDQHEGGVIEVMHNVMHF
jgi:hypothetical protein